MTTQIPDSWELPSYTAGDVIPFGRRQNPQPPPAPRPSLGDIEPYDPEIHGRGPAEMYSQDTLDALEGAGFAPHHEGVWHRSLPGGGATGAEHFLYYNPGQRGPEGNRIPWHLTHDENEFGRDFQTLRGALRAADAEAEQVRNPKISRRLFAAETPGQAAARKWLEENPEGFEEWHPEQNNDYTYSDFGDAAGMRHGPEGEAESWMMPGSAYHPERSWEDEEEQPIHGWRPTGFDPYNRHGEQDMFGDENNDEAEDDERNHNEMILQDHGFNWRAIDPTAGTHENPYNEDTPGEYYRYQHTPEGDPVATHIIGQNPATGRWHVERHPAGSEGRDHTAAEPHSVHNWLSDALDRYRQNSADSLLPRSGYDYASPWFWTRDDPAPSGSPHHYEHQIEFPEEGGFSGTTRYGDQTMTQQSHDLADIVRDQNMIGQGMHPGGVHDHRWNVGEFRAHPSVALLGKPHVQGIRGGRVESMDWHIPVEGEGQFAHANARYNWDTGDYDFRYRNQQGERLAPTHNYVPAGAPVTIPGRQR